MELFGFGPHLMIDGYHADPALLDSIDVVTRVLDDLPDQMEMTKITPPNVMRYSGLRPEDAGVTGVVIIAESHIAIHTFPHKGFLSIDIFSCKSFDAQKAVQSLIDAFRIGRCDTHFINRGKEFPKDLESAQRIVSGDRDYVSTRAA